jgi:hypothetical protein
VVHDPDSGDILRQQVDLGANEVGVAVRFLPGEKIHTNGPGLDNLGIDPLFYFPDELGAQALELEVHATSQGFHVVPGDLGPVVPPNDAAEDVKRGVRSHQGISALPVQLTLAGTRNRKGIPFDFVPDCGALPPDLADGQGPVDQRQATEVVGLAAATREEGSGRQGDLHACDGADRGLEASQVGIRLI